MNKVQKMQTGRGPVARFGRSAVATAVLLFVVACGGGNGSGTDVAADGSVPPSVTAQQTPTKMEAARFLGQATFGPNEAEIDRLSAMSYGAWIDEQLTKPQSLRRRLEAAAPTSGRLAASKRLSWRKRL